MSQARIYTTKKVQKDWVCGKCRTPIRKGVDGRISFAVGFRGYEQTRCTKPECRPTRSELESSAIASIYDAMDSIDYDSLQSLDDLTEARDSVVEAVNEVASEYEGNEMYDISEDLQERVSILEGASSELENWEPEGEAPEDEKDCDECDGTGQVESSIDHDVAPDVECEQCEGTGKVENDEDLDEWLQEARESLQAAIDEMELP
jgi:hypothetical protein